MSTPASSHLSPAAVTALSPPSTSIDTVHNTTVQPFHPPSPRDTLSVDADINNVAEERTSSNTPSASSVSNPTTSVKYDLTCNFCGKSGFGRPAHYESHIRTHTGERPFVCEFFGCNNSFRRKDHLDRHYNIHSGTRDQVCDYEGCNRAFVTAAQLQRHKNAHFCKVIKTYKCSICSAAFTKKTQLRTHNLNEHNIAPFACSFEGCGRKFIVESKLQRHESNAHRNFSRCICLEPDCNIVMSSEIDLFRHIQSEHPDQIASMIPPGDDDETNGATGISSAEGYFDTIGWIYETDKKKNNRRKKRKCSDDDEDDDGSDSSDEEGNRGDHNNSDEDNNEREKQSRKQNKSKERFRCTYEGCNRSFTQMKNLNAHTRAKHSDVLPFMCTYEGCTQGFGYKNVLLKHIQRIHIEGKYSPPKKSKGEDVVAAMNEAEMWDLICPLPSQTEPSPPLPSPLHHTDPQSLPHSA